MNWGVYLKYSLTTNNLNETINFGKILGENIKNGMVISLNGDIGCGKTHLTKGIALGLNIKENISSPTFNLVNEYEDGVIPLYHFDVYRLKSIDELFLIGFDDYINKESLTIIEWGDMIKDALPKDTNYINISKDPLETYKRTIELDFKDIYEDIIIKSINTFKGGNYENLNS